MRISDWSSDVCSSDLFFKDPELAHRLLAHTVPQSAAPKKNQPRPRALAALSSAARPPAEPAGLSLDLDAAMTSSHLAWLKQADFNQLGANEYDRKSVG